MLIFYNTWSRKKEIFYTAKEGYVRMYTCGPTVYDFAHIGNFRTYVFEDVLRRALRFFGYRLEQAMNFTDVDDKTIRGALREKIALLDYTARYKKAFLEDAAHLRCERVEYYPAATDYIGPMCQMIEGLLEKGVAYRGGDGSIYFRLTSFPQYGRLSHLKMDELQAGASQRVSADEYEKEGVADFVLWKAHDEERDGTIAFESPFGLGRPGWHLECSCMAMRLLGTSIDLHVGGVDNIFPHHENEIAQSEAYTGEPFCRFWMHAEHLLVDGKKMSKSAGNFYTVRNILEKGFNGQELRFALLQTHYRQQLNFTFAGLHAARASASRLNDFSRRLDSIEKKKGEKGTFTEVFYQRFYAALADDLNVPEALAAVFDFVRAANAAIDAKTLTPEDAFSGAELWQHFDSVLGICTPEQEPIPQEMLALVKERDEARAKKDFARADILRKTLLANGYIVEDGPQGARLKKCR